jgi:trimeric autotransporter adhesin
VLTVYGPTGAVITSALGTDVAGSFFSAQAAGRYEVVVSDGSTSSTSTGAYNLYLAVVPGADACGVLAPGAIVSGQLAEGAIDSYTFTANAGETIELRVTDTLAGSFVPTVAIYNPTGGLVSSALGTNVAAAGFSAATTGTYTVLIYDSSSGLGSTGPYLIHFVKAPGADADGVLTPGAAVSGQLAEGAIDSYIFTAAIGDKVALTATDVDGGTLIPTFAVYGPTGALETSAEGTDTATNGFSVPLTGTYTVVVYDSSSGLASTGPYTLSLALTPASH